MAYTGNSFKGSNNYKDRISLRGSRYTPIIPALGKLKQESPALKASLGYKARFCIKKKN
jgi:hypothetical protein